MQGIAKVYKKLEDIILSFLDTGRGTKNYDALIQHSERTVKDLNEMILKCHNDKEESHS